jgi:hypothetical protein
MGGERIMTRSRLWPVLLQLGRVSVAVAAMLAAPSIAQDLDTPRVAMARDKQCEIEVRGKDSIFTVFVTGLVPNETVEVISDSEGEIIQYPARADQKGQYSFVEIPLVRGKQSGIASIAITASRCRLKVSFPWRE